VICFNGDEQNPALDCDDDSGFNVGVVLFWMIWGVCVVVFLFLLGSLGLGQGCERRYGWVRMACILFVVGICFVQNFILLRIAVIGVVVIALIAPVLLDWRRWNRGGLLFAIVTVGQYFLTWEIFGLLASPLSDEMFPGIRGIVLLPILVQLNQGLLILVAEKLSEIVKVTQNNRDGLIYAAKAQIMSTTAMKLVILMEALSGSNPAITVIFSLLTDALGRIQIWRYLYRKFYSRFTGRPQEKGLKFLSEFLLCSEMDMDYYPWILLVWIHATSSPLDTTDAGVAHTADSHLSLRPDSLLNQPWSNVIMLLTILSSGDLVTFVFYQVFKSWQLYEIQHHFARNWKSCVIYGLAFGPVLISMLLRFGSAFR